MSTQTAKNVAPAVALGFKLMSRKDLLNMIKDIKGKVLDLDALIKSAALQCLAHGEAHGDVTLMEKLADAIPRGYWKNGFEKWLMKHSPIRIDPKDGKWHQLKEGDAGYKPYNIEMATDAEITLNTPNSTNRQERVFNLAMFDKMVTGLRKKVQSADEAGQIPKDERQKVYGRLGQVESFYRGVTANDPSTAPDKDDDASEADAGTTLIKSTKTKAA